MVSTQLLYGPVPVAAVLEVNSNGQSWNCVVSCVDVEQPLAALCLGMIFLCTWSCVLVGMKLCQTGAITSIPTFECLVLSNLPTMQ